MIIDLGPNLGSNHLEKNRCTVRLVQAGDCKLLGSARLESKQRSFKNVHLTTFRKEATSGVSGFNAGPLSMSNWKFLFHFSRGKKTGEPG